MKNNKGVTLATVVVTIIVMLIVATVSIVAGNKLILSSNEYAESQEYESVVAAVRRKKTEVGMAGSLIPIGESYVGVIDPIIKSDSEGTVIATGWYLLDEVALEKLGVHDVSSRYLVNYDYVEVLSTTNPDYIEEYMVIEFLHHTAETERIGTPLKNKKSGDTSGKMVSLDEKGELFGTGWYLITGTKDGTNEFPEKYASYIRNSYLVNYEKEEYVKLNKAYTII